MDVLEILMITCVLAFVLSIGSVFAESGTNYLGFPKISRVMSVVCTVSMVVTMFALGALFVIAAGK